MAAPYIKFEHSPAVSMADSFASSPGSLYPSLFDGENEGSSNNVLTPPFEDDFDQSCAGTPSPEKKQAKKRKSWGQQLPEPKTNLPPRKRAKTEDEKEQRRVERVLRNRRAAQSSRERKRQEVELLEAQKQTIEKRFADLEQKFAESEAARLALERQLAKLTGTSIFTPPALSAQIQPLQAAPVTLSKDLFGSTDSNTTTPLFPTAASFKLEPTPTQTVNPASLSPELSPIAESSNARSSDQTQHPAAMLFDNFDLQCQSEDQRPWMTLSTSQPSTWTISLVLLLMSLTSSTILAPLSRIMTSLRTGSYLSPTSSVLSLTIWMLTTPTSILNSTTTSTPATTYSSTRNPRFSLRMNLLRRLLSCNPHMARPLLDATLSLMRSVSEQQLRARDFVGGGVGRGDGRSGKDYSITCLLTLAWAIQVIDRGLHESHGDGQNATDGRASPELEELFGTTAAAPAPRIGLAGGEKLFGDLGSSSALGDPTY